jgi:uncharacterized damage-inducible protein DinB
MTYAQTILPEFDQEMASTRKVLERVPEDKLDWKPHPKSNTIGWNANHLAEMPGWVVMTIGQPSLDIAPAGAPAYQSPKGRTRGDILAVFDKNVAAARQAISGAKDEEMDKPWSLLKGGQAMFTMPRRAVVRSFVINHIIHHRAVLCVYLRLNDVPVPGMYGPSGDDGGFNR